MLQLHFFKVCNGDFFKLEKNNKKTRQLLSLTKRKRICHWIELSTIAHFKCIVLDYQAMKKNIWCYKGRNSLWEKKILRLKCRSCILFVLRRSMKRRYLFEHRLELSLVRWHCILRMCATWNKTNIVWSAWYKQVAMQINVHWYRKNKEKRRRKKSMQSHRLCLASNTMTALKIANTSYSKHTNTCIKNVIVYQILLCTIDKVYSSSDYQMKWCS